MLSGTPYSNALTPLPVHSADIIFTRSFRVKPRLCNIPKSRRLSTIFVDSVYQGTGTPESSYGVCITDILLI